VVINTSGAITTTGAFTSVGIDDNAASTAITIDSSENVGIGETAPLGKVHIKQNDSGVTSAPAFADALFIEDNSNTGITICTPTNGIGTIAFGDSGDNDIGKFQYQHSDNSMLFVANAAERMRITSAGNVGIGTSSPGEKLDINGSARVSTGSSYQFGGSEYKIEGSNVTNPRIGFITNSTERMRIDSAGNVLVNSTTTTAGLAAQLFVNSSPAGKYGIGVGYGTSATQGLLHKNYKQLFLKLYLVIQKNN
jgi:hypothetical protein